MPQRARGDYKTQILKVNACVIIIIGIIKDLDKSYNPRMKLFILTIKAPNRVLLEAVRSVKNYHCGNFDEGNYNSIVLKV